MLGFAVLEIQFYANSPTNAEIEDIAAQNVASASKAFENFIYDFEEESQNLANSVQSVILSDTSVQKIYEALNKNKSLWGASLIKNGEAIVWTGFKTEPHDIQETIPHDSSSVTIQKNQNVTTIHSTKPILSTSGDKYSLVTAKKLKQTNVLDLGEDTEITLSETLKLDFEFPVHFALLEPVPDETIFKIEQSYAENSFNTTVYASSSDITAYENSRKAGHSKLRLILIILILLTGSIFLLTLSSLYDSRKTFLISTISVLLVWILSWVLLPHLDLELALGMKSINLELFYLGLNSFLAFAFAIFISDFYYSNQIIEEKFNARSGYLSGAVTGILIALVFIGIAISLFNITANTSLNLNDLSLVPDTAVLLYYFLAGTFWITASWSTVYLILFLLKFTEGIDYICLLSITGGFFTTALLLHFFYLEDQFSWVIYLATLLVLFLTITAYFSGNGILDLRSRSRLRLFLIICLFASFLSYVPFYFGQIEWRSKAMLTEAENFAQEGELEIENITIETLFVLEERLSNLEINSVQNQNALLTSTFNEQVQTLFNNNPDWQSFSFSVQLINSSGDPLSEFTSNLNAPGWTKAYDMFSLEVPFEQERIRRDRLRPIIRKNPLEQPPAKYTSFRQGWIPFFASPTSEEKLGWIICSVYQEQPQYRKPLRAVIASKKEGDSNTTFLLSAYENGQLTRNSLSGLPIEIPNYTMLPEAVAESLSQDSLFTTFETLNETEVVELFWKRSGETVIKVSALNITLFNHAFSLLRLFFYLLIFIFALSLLLQWKRNLQILGTNRRFKDRLIDRFIIASLFCLTALIATSSLAITKQSEEATIEELKNKLVGINASFEDGDSNDINQTLLRSSTLINSDAVLFEDNELIGSTAPQIFSQHLLPAQVPWDVYNSIVNSRSELEVQEFKLGGLEFLIGYTPVLKDGAITNIVAIPTFLKTPSFNEQLLTTISYLVGLFVLIFGIFIFAAALIANRMTNPLEELSEGIDTISEGSLETTLPVTSNDEIGSLTNSFNIMVYRLQELRKNLVEAEREAAWKEMAQQVAHEIKNPLTPMKLNLQHLDRQIKAKNISQDELKEKVEKINANMIEQIESLSRIASDFSKFARPVEQEFSEIDLNAVLQNVADLYSNEESITIDLKLNKNPLVILGVKDELQRVFINLVKNGIEAIPKKRKGLITIKSWHADYKANVEIFDNGEGIFAEDINSIFVPNFSTKSSGTGLGLAITKKVVEEHGGEINFTSELGEGTSFTLHFDLFTEKEG